MWLWKLTKHPDVNFSTLNISKILVDFENLNTYLQVQSLLYGFPHYYSQFCITCLICPKKLSGQSSNYNYFISSIISSYFVGFQIWQALMLAFVQDTPALCRLLQQPRNGPVPGGARGLYLRNDAQRSRDRRREVRRRWGRLWRLFRIPLQWVHFITQLLIF